MAKKKRVGRPKGSKSKSKQEKHTGLQSAHLEIIDAHLEIIEEFIIFKVCAVMNQVLRQIGSVQAKPSNFVSSELK